MPICGKTSHDVRERGPGHGNQRHHAVARGRGQGMKALVFDVDPNEIIHLIQEARDSKEAYLGEHALLRLEEVADAKVPFPDWGLIKTHLTGICGSDYKQVFVDFAGYDSPMAARPTFPQGMGHGGGGT